jgi:hypothetical protein
VGVCVGFTQICTRSTKPSSSDSWQVYCCVSLPTHPTRTCFIECTTKKTTACCRVSCERRAGQQRVFRSIDCIDGGVFGSGKCSQDRFGVIRLRAIRCVDEASPTDALVEVVCVVFRTIVPRRVSAIYMSCDNVWGSLIVPWLGPSKEHCDTHRTQSQCPTCIHFTTEREYPFFLRWRSEVSAPQHALSVQLRSMGNKEEWNRSWWVSFETPGPIFARSVDHRS